MKNYFILALLCTVATQSWSMERVLKLLSGEQIIKYERTTDQEREDPIKIWNQTGKRVILQATYLCKTKAIYTALCCFGSCCAVPAKTTLTEQKDTLVLFNNNQTLTVAPVQPNISKSRIKLLSLKARYAHGPGEWVEQPLPTSEKTFKQYQSLQEIINEERTYTLTEQCDKPMLQ